uniref:Putative Copper-exporting ATPase-fragment CopA n=1 Tax=mine drainage metagenome TaxID=410659 RepID=E6QS90_9ZZZZ
MHETTLQISGMTCNHCVMSVTRTLQKVPGVENVQVDLAEGEAVVRGNASVEAMVAAVKATGYGAEVES